MRRRAIAFLVTIAALTAGCDADDASSEIRERLVGTWLRDYRDEGTHVRRILVLEPGGRFREMSRTLGPEQADTEHLHEGEWVYDGTNLKRRYTLMDGKQPAAPTMPFVAFQIRFEGNHDFVGVDNVRRRELRYHRVADGTRP